MPGESGINIPAADWRWPAQASFLWSHWLRNRTNPSGSRLSNLRLTLHHPSSKSLHTRWATVDSRSGWPHVYLSHTYTEPFTYGLNLLFPSLGKMRDHTRSNCSCICRNVSTSVSPKSCRISRSCRILSTGSAFSYGKDGEPSFSCDRLHGLGNRKEFHANAIVPVNQPRHSSKLSCDPSSLTEASTTTTKFWRYPTSDTKSVACRVYVDHSHNLYTWIYHGLSTLKGQMSCGSYIP